VIADDFIAVSNRSGSPPSHATQSSGLGIVRDLAKRGTDDEIDIGRLGQNRKVPSPTKCSSLRPEQRSLTVASKNGLSIQYYDFDARESRMQRYGTSKQVNRFPP
jgi:hypothetical protein